jgi:hypothetical protein
MAIEDGSPGLASAVIGSPARKLLIPIWKEGWDWAGLDRFNTKATVDHTVRAIRQIVEGEEVKIARPMSAGAIVGIVIGVLFFLIVVILLISNYM